MEEKAKRILANNLFMTLATASSGGQPWSTPVFYALDENYTFYWYSRRDTRHSQNITENNKISASVFATSGENEGVGIYIEGTASEVTEEELDYATSIYAKKAAANEEEKTQLTTREDFLGDAQIRMYKLIPEKVYISEEATKWNGKWIDKREEVKL